MGRKQKSEPKATKPRRRPATSPEQRENQLISMAYDVAEQQLRDGTISSAALTQLLKAGSYKNQLELEKLRSENEVLIAKAEALQSAKHVEELYSEALNAFRAYNGQGSVDNDV